GRRRPPRQPPRKAGRHDRATAAQTRRQRAARSVAPLHGGARAGPAFLGEGRRGRRRGGLQLPPPAPPHADQGRRRKARRSRGRRARRSLLVKPMLSVAEAQAKVLEGLKALKSESVSLGAASGRVLSADVAANRTQPSFDVSAMDGYAVKASDVATLPAAL